MTTLSQKETKGDEKLPFCLPEMAGCESVWLEEKQGYKITIPNGALLYIPNFLSEKEKERALDYLLKQNDDGGFTNIPWRQEYIAFFNKKQALPRLTSWHGDQGKAYHYSGIVNNPEPWNPCLSYIKDKINKVVPTPFNSVLLNWYRNSSDSIGWHSDDEPELGKNPVIASVSIGEERAFLIRNKFDHALKFNIMLGSGSLLIMAGEMQTYWQHSIAKQSRQMNARVNMTFRNIITNQ